MKKVSGLLLVLLMSQNLAAAPVAGDEACEHRGGPILTGRSPEQIQNLVANLDGNQESTSEPKAKRTRSVRSNGGRAVQ